MRIATVSTLVVVVVVLVIGAAVGVAARYPSWLKGAPLDPDHAVCLLVTVKHEVCARIAARACL